ncbi:hypothetical protein EGJ23_01625 [Pseudomonas sp. o96-267]|uniref:hypothetical protein n=1 Tax=Pseudomonas sp. o96-267 TaxID=2479853 RepID=UPI000F771E33|nr:hypothetical protein [Pseudomonas sp. o96-267]RRV29663.1 hypothetical protein EGJ23_01625 [Pseudomonas sp. o96-267]
MSAPEISITIQRGKTFEFGFVYAEDELLYLPITGMPSKAPVRLTVEGHGVPDGWPVQVTCVKAPAELNTPDDESQIAKLVDVDTVELNALNAHCWKAFSGSGLLVLNKPMDLTGWHCRAQVRDKPGGAVLFTWHSDPAESPDGEIEVDLALSAFVLKMDADTAAALPWKRGKYDVEAIAPGGEVYPLTAISDIEVADEVTA